MTERYLHGYSPAEQQRLVSQGQVLGRYVYERINLEEVRSLVELGAGVGAQMAYVLDRYPDLHVTGIDISKLQLEVAKRNLSASGISEERFQLIHADVRDTGLPSQQTFDAGMIVWVLEHISECAQTLTELRRILLPRSRVFVTEVLNQSFYISPQHAAVTKFWTQMNEYQSAIGGNPDVGAHLGDLLERCGYADIQVVPYVLHFDRRDKDGRDAFLDYWFHLIRSSRDEMLVAGFTTRADWQAFATAWREIKQDESAVFFYTFMQAFARTL